MKGEFRGDFSRDTFDPSKDFLRVLMQQGRVSLDADWNEQVDILLHYMQTLAKDLIGPHAGPMNAPGFGITNIKDSDFSIGSGRYYVDGILCENYAENLKYSDKLEGIGIEETDTFNDGDLVYLDVWERHISFVEDDDIREKALDGPDTAARSKVVWLVKVLKQDEPDCQDLLQATCEDIRAKWPVIVETCLQPCNRGLLKAKAKEASENDKNPCIVSPEARYRGAENQLYRVEIHRGGKASGNTIGDEKSATFKWSRENGSVIFPILDITGNIVTLENLGRDDRLSLKVNDWVEIIDDDYTMKIQTRPPLIEPRPLAKVEKIDLEEMKVTLKLTKALPNLRYYEKEDFKGKHTLLKRWDCKKEDNEIQDEAGAFGLLVKENTCGKEDIWLTLEDGVQICFLSSPPSERTDYQAGDYWLIPARTITGKVEWPGSVGCPEEVPPHGIYHHYAPLAILKTGESSGSNDGDCRCWINQICSKTQENENTSCKKCKKPPCVS